MDRDTPLPDADREEIFDAYRSAAPSPASLGRRGSA